jgi:tyrosine-specific transport protein
MLALPLKTAAAGFLPSIALFIVCFLFMLYTVFLLLEATLMSAGNDSNFISMTGQRLGRGGQIAAWGFFLLLLYSVSAAYMSAGGSLLTTLLRDQVNPDTPMFIGMLLFAILFGFVVFFGTRTVDNINKFLVIGLILSFVLLISGMVPSMDMSHVRTGVHPLMLLVAVPVVILSFTSHVIVPSLRSYLNSDVVQLKRALFWGMIIPLVFYICWEFLILSLIPSEGPHGIMAIAQGEHPVAALTDTLQENLNLPFIAAAVGSFSFCALVTSFLAVNLSLKDFLADGLTIPKTTAGRLFICFLTVLPPLAYALLFPKGFTFALGYAGVFVAVLYGILPALMVYRGRYVQGLKAPYTTPGGKLGLVFVLLGSGVVIGLQILATLGYF